MKKSVGGWIFSIPSRMPACITFNSGINSVRMYFVRLVLFRIFKLVFQIYRNTGIRNFHFQLLVNSVRHFTLNESREIFKIFNWLNNPFFYSTKNHC
jgi:hypothetical protein